MGILGQQLVYLHVFWVSVVITGHTTMKLQNISAALRVIILHHRSAQSDRLPTRRDIQAMRFLSQILLVLSVAFAASNLASAAIDPDVKKELTEMGKELRPVSGMIRKKEVKEAKAIISKIEDRLKELKIDDGERDRSFSALKVALAKAKNLIPVSFEKEVAPIIKDKCLGCHGANQASAKLRMDTYANMGKGGQNGPLLLPRNPRQSLIMARIMTDNAQARMPKRGDKLTDDQISIIGRWIAGGAAFDGEDMQATIGDSLVEKKEPRPPVKVVMADGSETVSFKKDVAPMLVNVCTGCHGGNNPRGGFNMTSFEQLLSGGDTGSTIVPGDPDSSYIVDLVLRQDPLKMPAGNQTRIKQSQAKALEKWIKEGAHFDGTDPKAALRSIVPTAAQLEAAKLASMSDTDFKARRLEQAASLWKRVAPREEATSVTTENLYVYGNAPQSRLDEFATWGEEQVTNLTGKYKLPGGEKPWRGRLVVFVSKTRFDYEEFNTVVMNGRRTPASISGHTVISPGFETAYVVMHDVGNADSADSQNAHQLLNSLLAQAYLSRSGGTMPDWLQQGFGLLESGAASDSPFLRAIPQKAGQSLTSINNPASLFDDGTFAPEEVGAVGMLLTRFLINRGGMAKLKQLAGTLQTERNAGRAVQATYGQSAAQLAQAFIQSGGR